MLFAAALLTSCGTEPEEKTATAPSNLQTVELQFATIPQTYEALGSIRSTTRSTVASRLMGTVVSVSANEGDVVRRGQLLVEIDARDVDAQVRKAHAGQAEVEQAIQGAEAALSAADANLDLATATYRRYESLRERRSVSPQEFEEVEARYKAARAERERGARQLEGLQARRQQALADVATAQTYGSWARVTSPIDGIVTARLVDVGDQASPGLPLFRIDDPTDYRLDVQVDESRLPHIQVGDPVGVVVDSTGLQTKGTVEAVAPAVSSASRSALVKVALPPASGIQSGMFARAYFSTGERQALLVPTSAISQRGQLEGVYVLGETGQAQFRLIRTGNATGENTEVLSGLNAGDEIVTGEMPRDLERKPVASVETRGRKES